MQRPSHYIDILDQTKDGHNIYNLVGNSHNNVYLQMNGQTKNIKIPRNTTYRKTIPMTNLVNRK